MATDKQADDIQARSFMARDMERHVRSLEAKREAKVDYPKTATPEYCAVFTSLIQQMRNSKKLSNMRGESWKFRCQQQCLASPKVERSTGGVCAPCICKKKYACIVEADESTRKRMEGLLHTDHEDHIAGKRNQFIEPLQSRTQIYPYASSDENSGRKSSSGKITEKT